MLKDLYWVCHGNLLSPLLKYWSPGRLAGNILGISDAGCAIWTKWTAPA